MTSQKKNRFSCKSIAIIGMGFMGANIAHAIKSNQLSKKITAYDTNEKHLAVAKRNQIIDETATNLKEAIADADLIIIATPINALSHIFSELKNNLKKNTIITDICSTKQFAITEARQLGNHFSQFVPGHPIAGSEKSGPEILEDLLTNKIVVLTPSKETDLQAIQTIESFWNSLKAKTVIMDAATHDKILALTSHVPHFLIFALLNCFNDDPTWLDYTGSGFQSLARIGGASPEIWSDIALSNADALLNQVEHFQNHLQRFVTILKSKDKSALKEFISQANHILK